MPVVLGNGVLRRGQSYASKVLAIPNIIQYLKVDETSGAVAADSSAGGNPGAYSNCALALIDGPTAAMGKAAQWNGSTSVLNLYSAGLASAFNGAEGSFAVWCKMENSGIWSDGTNRRVITVRIDSSNIFNITKSSTSNTILGQYIAGGATKTVTVSSYSNTSWFHACITWSKSSGASGEFKFYLDGVQQGTTQTSLGTWAGSLSSSQTILGGASTSPANVHAGYLCHSVLFSRAITQAEVTSLASF